MRKQKEQKGMPRSRKKKSAGRSARPGRTSSTNTPGPGAPTANGGTGAAGSRGTTAEYTNFLLKALLKTASSTEDDPYNYHPRHFSKDPEYKWDSERKQEFKRGFPAPDVSMLRPQGDAVPPHRGNYPRA